MTYTLLSLFLSGSSQNSTVDEKKSKFKLGLPAVINEEAIKPKVLLTILDVLKQSHQVILLFYLVFFCR